MAIASARLLSSDAYYTIANRIYVVIGVVMLFVLSYSILKAIIDPDQATKGELGAGTVKRVIIAVIGLAITPVLFNVLYQAQGLFLEKDVIGKIFFRMDTSADINYSDEDLTFSGSSDEQIKNIGGSVAAVSIWQAFFYATDGDATAVTTDASDVMGAAAVSSLLCAGAAVAAVAVGISTFGIGLLIGGAALALCVSAGNDWETYSDLQDYGDISLQDAYNIASGTGSFNVFLAFSENFKDGEVTYLWFVSTVCGAFCLYAFISFSIDMGVRAAKLAYYQIIAPIPLIMQVLPKFKDNFSKYISGVVSTFLEVFVRISIVYIVVYVISHLQELFSTGAGLWANDALNIPERALAMALLILGLVLFAKQAPELITSSLGVPKGSMNLGIGKKLADSGGYGAASAIGAGYTGLNRNGRKALDALKDKRKNGNARIGDYARVAFSALGGAGSAAARSVYEQARPGGRPVKNLHDVAENAGRAAQAAVDAREEREKRRAPIEAAKLAYESAVEAYDAAIARGEQAGLTGDALRRFAETEYKAMEAARIAYRDAIADNSAIAVGLDNLRKKREAWVVGTIDTSYDDNLISLYGTMNDFKDKSRAKTAKDANVQAAQLIFDRINSETVSEYREEDYSNAVKAAVDSVVRAAGMSDDDYNAARARAAQSISKESFRRTDKEMEDALADLRKRKQAAKDNLEAAQDAAFANLLRNHDAGAVELMAEFRANNIAAFRKYADEMIEVDGEQVKIKDYVKSFYGVDLQTGRYDDSVITGPDSKKIVVTNVEGRTGEFEFEIEYSSDGKPVAYVDKNGVFGAVNEKLDFEAFHARVTKSHAKASSQSIITRAADKAKAAKLKKSSDSDYQKKLQQKRDAAEAKKKKNNG